MKKQLTYPIKLMVLIIWSLLLQPFIIQGQRIYHIDPNETKPGEIRSALPKEDMVAMDKIIIRNNYSSPVTVLVSLDNKTWDTLQIKEKNAVSSKQKTMYIKVYTSSKNFKMYQLTAGSLYQVYWNKDEQFWQIIK